jgi:hypothetical protein
MSLIDPDLSGIVDGQTGDAVDWTNPINTIVNEINGGLSNDNISSSAAISLSKLAGDAWTSFTPTFTNLTVGNGTLVGAYQQIGKTTLVRVKLTFGSTTSVAGVIQLTTPVSVNSAYAQYTVLGGAAAVDSGTGVANANVIFYGSGKVAMAYQANTTAAYSEWTTAVPFTWTTNDSFHLQYTFEAA